MLLGILIAALRVWLVNPYTSDLGKRLVIWYTFNTKSIAFCHTVKFLCGLFTQPGRN
jgi:hypothetical protein